MKLLLVLAFIGGICAYVPDTRVGCENTPCDHQCFDTVDSYFCQCYENWELHPDGHSCIQLAQNDYDAAYLGCWEDSDSERDLPYLIWTRPDDCNVPQCIHDCRARGFTFAGLQSGDQCWCGSSFVRRYYDNGTCDMVCPGSSSQYCGGDLSNSVYKVTRDSRYAGCYYEDFADPDLPVVLWDMTAGKSVDECTIECSKMGYNYAGIFDGGQCSCGDTYGKYGLAGEVNCTTRCFDGYSQQNCGGNETNAIYRIVRGRDYSYMEAKFADEGRRATLPASEIYKYPHQLGIYSRRFVAYASDTVNNIYDDVLCASGDCYATCGEISVPEGIDKYRADVYIRKFYLKMSELLDFIQYPNDTQRIFIFAQTLYIDQSVDYPWPLFIRARQIIINYEVGPSITFSHIGMEFGYNISQALIEGPASDLTFQKQSLLCARILLSSESDDDNRLAWNIIDDLVRDRAYTVEQTHFLDAVRGYRSQFTSVGRNDLHWAPYYTQAFYVTILETYHLQISIYRDNYNELLDDAIECNNFLERSSTLIGIWTDAVVTQSRILKEHAETNLAISEETYERIYIEYNESRAELEVAADNFRAGLEKWKKEQMRKAFFGFIGAMIRMAFGIRPAFKGRVKDAVDGVIAGLKLLEVTMENLAATVEEMETFLLITDSIIETKDYERYMENVESVAGLYIVLPEWENLKYQTDVIFRDEEFRFIEGALELSFAVFDLCNWGEALTRSMIEYANNIRVAVTFDALYQNRVEMQARYEAYFAQVGEDCLNKEQMIIAFAEQHYDIMIELNNQLIQYCEAHYYETLSVCPEDARPVFEASVDVLLSSVYKAMEYSGSYFRSSSYELDVEIIDDLDSWDNCTNSKNCPLKVFKDSRMLYYELPTDHRRFLDIDLILVEEIILELPGAVSTNASQDLRLLISSSGPFINRLNCDESTFITRALSEMKFQYDIETGQIELYANIYEPGGNGGSMIKHMTPFTTWLIQVDPQWTHIDISGVEKIVMILKGPFKNGLKEKEIQDARRRKMNSIEWN